MPSLFGARAVLAAAAGDSSPGDVFAVALLVAVVVGVMYAVAASRRARSRRSHVDVAATGHGAWEGTVSSDDLIWLFPDVAAGQGVVSFLLSDGAVPVTLHLDPDGLRLELTGRLVRRADPQPWSAPWADIVAGATAPAGFRTLGGKRSVIRLTDVLVTVVGPSAREFLEFWALDDDDEDDVDEPLTPEEQAEDVAWLEEARRDLGPAWTPGTALLRIRMSAADGVAEAISRWARGRAPSTR